MTEREMLRKIFQRISFSFAEEGNYMEADVDKGWIIITFDNKGNVLTMEGAD